MSKIGVIGAGAVGSAALLSLVVRGSAREIVVLNRGRKRARAVATDLRYGAALSAVVDVHDGDYPDLAGASLVMIAAGINEKTGGATDRKDEAGRLRLLDGNVAIYRDILPQLYRVARDATILVLTDPPDPLADVVRSFGFEHVLSSGTLLDSLRFRDHLARRLEVAPSSVSADVLGASVRNPCPRCVAAEEPRPLRGPEQRGGGSREHRAGGPLREHRHHRRESGEPVRDRDGGGAHRGDGAARRASGHSDRFLQPAVWLDAVGAKCRRAAGSRP